MEILHRSVRELTPTEYRACLRANYGPDNGYMWEELTRCRTKGQPGTVIMLWEGPDDDMKSLRAWCLLTPVRLWGLIGVTRWVMKKSKFSAMFWVKRQYRGRGYSHILMREVKKYDDNPHVMPHDKASGEFFSGYKVQVMRDDKEHMTRKPRVA